MPANSRLGFNSGFKGLKYDGEKLVVSETLSPPTPQKAKMMEDVQIDSSICCNIQLYIIFRLFLRAFLYQS